MIFGDWLSLEAAKDGRDALIAAVRARPGICAIGFFWLCVTATAFCFPAAPLIGLVGGALFGFWQGLLMVTIASAIGSTLHSSSRANLMRDWVKRRLGPRSQRSTAALANKERPTC